eukprot:8831864-Ditylum_brightwellii.AAC.1
MHNDMKIMMEHNMAATSNMIQVSISTALNTAPKGKSGPKNSTLSFGSVKQDSTSNAAEK